MAHPRQSSPPAAGVAPADALAITADDFSFLGYSSNPKRYFDSRPRPFRFIQSPPALTEYDDVIYAPSTRTWKPFDGCLYDAAGARIDASVIHRNHDDLALTSEPATYAGRAADLPRHDGAALYLGYFNWHYGHFLLETLSYWWALVEQHPDVDRYLIHLPDKAVLDKPYVQACLAAVGIDRSQLLHFDAPTRLTHVIVPNASFQLNSHVYRSYRTLMNRLAAGLGAGDAPPTDQPLYISRRLLAQGNSLYKGEQQLEEYLAARGVLIAHPQQLPFRDQVHLFNRHKTILGIIGSGMHNIVLALEPKRMVYLTPDVYKPNAFLVDRCFAADSTYIQACRAADNVSFLGVRLRRLLTGKLGRNEDGFRTNHNLDHEQIVKHLAALGVIGR